MKVSHSDSILECNLCLRKVDEVNVVYIAGGLDHVDLCNECNEKREEAARAMRARFDAYRREQ